MAFMNKNDVREVMNAMKLSSEILREAYANPTLDVPSICPIERINKLEIRVPIMSKLHINMQMDELESMGTDTPVVTKKEVKLYCDRFGLEITDQSRIQSDYGNPMDLFVKDQGKALSEALNIQIATALSTDPLTLTTTAMGAADIKDALFDWVFPAVTEYFGDRKPTGICCSPITWQTLQGVFNAGYLGHATFELVKQLPGFGLDVVTSTRLPTSIMYFVCNDVPGIKCYEYDTVEPEMDRDPNRKCDVLYGGIYRAVASNFRQATVHMKNPDTGETLDRTQTGNAGVVAVAYENLLHANVREAIEKQRVRLINEFDASHKMHVEPVNIQTAPNARED